MELVGDSAFECGEQCLADAEVVRVTDNERTAVFVVQRFVLRGVRLSSTHGDELAVARDLMLGTPIDPQVLEQCQTVSAALGAIAVNSSNICCFRLNKAWEGTTVADRCNILPLARS